MPRVMIAEDDPVMAGMLEETLVANGDDVCGTAGTVEKAVELGERYKPDLAVLDIRLADGGLGTEIAARLKSRSHGCSLCLWPCWADSPDKGGWRSADRQAVPLR